MSNIKVSEMTEATSFDDGDYTMIVQANQNKKISKENILGDIENNITVIDNNIGDLSNLETSDKSSVVNAINSQIIKKLWENLNPNDDFSTQSITLSSDDYDYLIIFWLNYKTSNRLDTTITLKNYGAYLNLASDYSPGGGVYYASSYVREFDRNTDTSFTFKDCFVRYSNSTSRPTSNGNIIPVFIYGGKFQKGE